MGDGRKNNEQAIFCRNELLVKTAISQKPKVAQSHPQKMIHTPKPKIEQSTLLPIQARKALVEAGKAKDLAAINAAHRYARAMHPEFFRTDDDSQAVKEPK